MVAGWSFKTGTANYWIRLNTYNTPTNPNPAIALDQKLQFKYYANHTTQVGIGVRETSTTAAIGADGGITGVIEFLGVLTRLELRVADGALLHAASLDLPPEGVTTGAPITLAYDPARVTVFRQQ